MNKPNIYKNIISISSFQNGVNDLINSTGFYFKMKVMEGSHKGKNNVFLICGHLFSKMYIFGYPMNSTFKWQYFRIFSF